MAAKLLITLGLFLISCLASAASTLYCPERSQYIQVGMSENQVLAACGPPLNKRQSNSPVTVKVPVTQFIYNTLNTGSVYTGLNSAFYNQWSLSSGSTGTNVQVDVINNKVSSIKINGSASNAMTICGGSALKVGDSVNSVYTACGQPQMMNNTYVNQPVPSQTKPEIWVYQIDKYQQPFTLTFLGGKLQSID